MKVASHELDKPIYFEDGRYITLRELPETPRLATSLSAPEIFEKMNPDILRSLILARYEREPRNKLINLVGRGSFSIDDLIAEVKTDSDVGRLVIRKEVGWINHLARLFLRQSLDL